MPIDLQHAEAMLKQPDCPFTAEQLEACKQDNSKPLFEWAGIDIYLIVPLKAVTKQHTKIPRPNFNKHK